MDPIPPELYFMPGWEYALGSFIWKMREKTGNVLDFDIPDEEHWEYVSRAAWNARFEAGWSFRGVAAGTSRDEGFSSGIAC